MGSRVAAMLIALAMLVPASALAAGPACGSDMLVKGACCCDHGVDETPRDATIESTCCCEIDQAPAGVVVVDATTQSTQLEDRAALSAQDVPGASPVGPAGIATLPVGARGPPWLRSLFAQRTSLIC